MLLLLFNDANNSKNHSEIMLFSILLSLKNVQKKFSYDHFLTFFWLLRLTSGSIQSAIFAKVIKKTKCFIKINEVDSSNGLCSTIIFVRCQWFHERKVNPCVLCHGHFWNFDETRLKMSNPYPHDVHIYLPNFKPNYVNRGSVKSISV